MILSTEMKRRVALVINILIALLELAAVVITIVEYKTAWMFIYYTQQSNIVLGISSGIYVYKVLQSRKEQEILFCKPHQISYPVYMAKYIATCLTTVTFVVVLAVLIPMAGGYGKSGVAARYLFRGSNLWMHFVCPVLGLCSFVFFEHEYKLKLRTGLIAAAPTLLYAIVTTILNFARVISGPYPFLKVYEQPWYMTVIWFITIPLAAYLIALLIRLLNKLAAPK